MKVPKDFIVEKDKSPERKANLSQLDIKFSKAVSRLQNDIELGIEDMFNVHLKLRGFTATQRKSVKIRLCPPSDMNEKRRLELDEKKLMIVGQVQGLNLFDDEYIYKTYFDMSDKEIADMKDRMKRKAEEEAQPAMGGEMGGEMGGDVMPPGDTTEAEPGAEATGSV